MSMDYITKTLNIYKQVKTFDYNPRYYARVASYGCTYELLVNDMPVDYDFGIGSTTGVTPFPSMIFNSGKQNLFLKVYPPVTEDTNKNRIPQPSIQSDATFKVEIFHEDQRYHNETSVLKFEMPKPGINIPYLEFKLEFNAKVPYNLNGWKNSQNLTKESSIKLLEEVNRFYQNFENKFAEKNLNEIAGLVYEREFETAQSYFFNKEQNSKDIIETLKADMADINEFLPCDDCKIIFYGNGKVVGLVRQTGKLKGDNGVIYRNKNKELITYGLLLHRPKAGGPLEIIR